MHVLDMETLSWTEMHASGPAPSPRAGHSTAILPNGNLVVWGGGGGQTALTADLHVLDTVHKMWSGALQLNKFSPEPRVGHSVHVLAACQLHLLPLCFDVYTAFNR